MAKGIRAFGLIAAAVWVAVALRGPDAWPAYGLWLTAGAIAGALVLPRLTAWIVRAVLAPPERAFTWGCAVAAAAISWFVVHAWLLDMPLSIDASVYLLEARAMSHLHFGMRAPLPMQAFANHFLFEGPDRELYGVFPPGWPLAIAAFVRLGVPMLAGPTLAALLVFAQAALGRAFGRATGNAEQAELATRASLVLSLPSVGRAMETADLLSHALVALLAAVAMTGALNLKREVAASPSLPKRDLFVVGACVGWAVASRLLDGVVLALVVAIALAWARVPARALVWTAAGALPFAGLLLVEQRCATGAWLLPSQSAYFARSDWPPGCHRLGLGVDIGCSVEHKGIVALYGPAGYDRHQALRVLSERAARVGVDLLSFPPLLLLAFVPILVSASAVDALGLGFVLLLTGAYGLFYYGPSQFFGARHLFPAAPFVWLLAARGACALPHRRAGWLDGAHARAAGVVFLLLVAGAAAARPWKDLRGEVPAYQETRSDLRRSFTAHGIDRGILKTLDTTAVAAAFDSWRDDDTRFFVVDDGSGVAELRRAHPDLPVYVSLPHDDVGVLYPQRPQRGALVELERTWPTFARPEGLGASKARRTGASGGAVLLLSHALPGAEAAIPFETAIAGDYVVRVDGLRGPGDGDYGVTLDGASLPDWHGYSAAPEPAQGEPVPMPLAAGRHLLTVRCQGRDERSDGYDGELDALVAQVSQPAP
jgi:hypothetical protein